MGTITFSSPPFCIYLKGCHRNATGDTLSTTMYSFDGGTATHGWGAYTPKGVLGTFNPYYNGDGRNAIMYFPTLDISIGPGNDSNYDTITYTSSGIRSLITSQTNTPFTWKYTYYPSTSSSTEYVYAKMTLHFSSDLKTGYIYASPTTLYAGAYGEYVYTTSSITSPTSITFSNISF